jgi:hypothetical protein
MCIGGQSGPSAADLAAQEAASAKRAEAETAKINAQKDIEKQAQNDKVVSDQATQANADAQRRIKNRTLLAGLGMEEEDTGLSTIEDPTSKSSAKARRAKSLIGSL